MVNIRTAMTGCIMGVLSLPMSAQGIFNEMSFSADKTVFRLNSPYKTTLRIYKDGEGGKPMKTVKMKSKGDGVWEAVVKGNLNGLFYTFDTGNGE